MYQIEWFDQSWYRQQIKHEDSPFQSKLPAFDVECALSVHWEEHCLECAPPACYASCPLYIERKDKKCKNLYFGIYRNNSFSGLFTYGAEVKFKKWGKLETELHYHPETVEEVYRHEKKNELIVGSINALYGPLSLLDRKRKLNGAYTLHKRKSQRKVNSSAQSVLFDEFVIECYSYESAPFRLIVENKSDIPFRTSVELQPGANFIQIPMVRFGYKNNRPAGTLAVYPENDLEVNVVFTWLDFVKYRTKLDDNSPKQETTIEAAKPAVKVKCVAWDLDNTLWKGVFIENKPADLVLNQGAIAVIRKLDEIGIIQTAISKNSEEEVMPYLKEIGLAEYFLYPAINWGQKSENLKKIAKALNINIDTFAVVDDSAFERSEVGTALPMVRVFAETQIGELLALPEFDVPVTPESKNRRKLYQTEQKRTEVSESFSGDYKSFIKNCEFQLTIFKPATIDEITRCYELIQRTNQLNISTKRYSEANFGEIVKDDTCLKLAFDCKDKFGEYGIVGFCIVKVEADNYRITDFVISCRIAQKMVEHSFIEWLFGQMKQKFINDLYVDFVRTSRNTPILAVFEEMEFEKQINENGSGQLYKNANSLKPSEQIITVYER